MPEAMEMIQIVYLKKGRGKLRGNRRNAANAVRKPTTKTPIVA
jgi:hypothetical protein